MWKTLENSARMSLESEDFIAVSQKFHNG